MTYIYQPKYKYYLSQVDSDVDFRRQISLNDLNYFKDCKVLL